MQHKTVKTLIALLALIVFLIASVPIRIPQSDARSWMAALDDNRSLNTLLIPGTHDSGALYSFADLFGKCQTLTIPQQLNIGVRFLDLRLRLVDDKLQVYHNFVEQKTEFSNLLAQLIAFLKDHPTEFLIISFKEEAAPVRSEKGFAESLEALLLQHPDVISNSGTLPKNVGSARGRIHILARYNNASIGIPCCEDWADNRSFALNGLYVQDHYKLTKTEDKLPHLTAAFAVDPQKYGLVLNYSSCYLSSGFPPAYAGTTARTINPWLVQYINGTDGMAGVLICDFMTSELANTILGRNFE